MSQVTDIILVTGIDDDRSNVELLNLWCEKNCGWGHGSGYLTKVSDHAGGGKAMQCDVYLAAINMLNEEAFMNEMKKIEWHEPITLLMKGEFDETFKQVIWS